MRKKKPVIVSSWKGIDYMRSKPSKYEVTKASLDVAHTYGVAMKVCAGFRDLLNPVLPYPKDRKMQIRFAQAMKKYLVALNSSDANASANLTGFNFNDVSTLQERFRVDMQVSQPAKNKIQLQLPAFTPVHAIAKKVNVTAVEIKIIAACAGLKSRRPVDVIHHTYTVAYTDVEGPAQTIELPLHKTPTALVIVVVALDFISGNNRRVTAKEFRPAGVVGVF